MNEGDGDDPGQPLFDDDMDKAIAGPLNHLNDTQNPSDSKETGKIEDIVVDKAAAEHKDLSDEHKEDVYPGFEKKRKKMEKGKGHQKGTKIKKAYTFDISKLSKNSDKDHDKILESSRKHMAAPALAGSSDNKKSTPAFHNIWRSKTTVLHYLELNLALKELLKKLSDSGFDCFEESVHNRFEDYRANIGFVSTGDFQWKNFFGKEEDNSAENLLDTLFIGHWSKFDYMLTFSEPLQHLFPLPLLEAFLSEELKSVPAPVLKKGLQFKASLLTMLWQYHLNHDTKHLLRIDHKNLKMLSPLIRSSIRNKNRSIANVNNKYFGEEWNLTKFMLRISSLMFHEEAITCDEGLLMQSRFLAVILTMCDLGIFPETEISELMNVIFRAVDALVKREQHLCASPLEQQTKEYGDRSEDSEESYYNYEPSSSYSDYESETSVNEEIKSENPQVTKESMYGVTFETLYTLQKCKQQIISILNHIAVLTNDIALLGGLLPWRNYSHLVEQFGLRSIYKSRPGTTTKTFLFESKTLCNQIILIASKAFFKSPAYDLYTTELQWNKFLYTMRNQEPLILKFAYTSQRVRTYSQDLMEMITNPLDDITMSSNKMIDDTLFEFLASSELMNPSKSVSVQVTNFSNRLATKFEEGLVTNFDTDENYSIELRILLEEIQSFVAANTKNLGVSVNFALNNVHTVLLSIAFMTEALSGEKKKFVDSRCCDLALAILGDISGDAISQGFLFTDFNWDLFQEMLTQRPHLLALILSRAFKNVSKNLNISYKEQLLEKLLPLFERLVTKSTEIIKTEFAYLYTDIDACPDGVISGAAEESANRLLLYLISVHSFSKTILSLNRNRGKQEEDFFNIDLHLQLVLRDCFFSLYFKKILKMGNEFLEKKPYQGYIPRFDFEKYAYEGFDYGQGITHDKLRGAIFSIGWSLTELMAKITSRIYLARDEVKATKCIQLDEITSTFAYLTSIDNGIQLKSVLLKFLSNFIIFRANNSLTTYFDERIMQEEYDSTQIFFGWEMSTPCYHDGPGAEYSPTDIIDFFCEELGFVGELRGQGSLRVQDGGLKESIRIYIFKGLFPSIYKFCKGFLGLLTISNYDIANSKTQIETFLEECMRFVKKLADFQRSVTQTLGISLTNGKSDNLVDFVLNIEKKKPKVDLKDTRDQSTQSEKFEERDEQLCPELGRVRTILRRIVRMIEESCPSEFYPYIDSFVRRNALKRRLNKLDGIFDSKFQKTRTGQTMDSSGTSKLTDVEAEMETLREKLNLLRRSYGSIQPLEHFKLACEIYQLRKGIWLKEDSNSNSFFKFLDDHPQDTERYVEFTLVMLQENLVEFVRRDQNIKSHHNTRNQLIGFSVPGMIVNRLPYTLLSQMEKLCSQTDRGRKKFFEIVGKSTTYGSLIISLIHSISQILRFNFLKTFHDMTYFQMNRLTDKLCEILDTFAEGGDKNFRKCISNEDYSEQVSALNYPLIQDLMYFLDKMLMVCEFVHLKQTKFVTMAEKPENFHIICKLINIILSCLSGPDIEGQSLIYGEAVDKLNMIFERVVHDINSPFYELKLQVVNYYSMMLEEAHIDNDTKMLTDSVSDKKFTVRDMHKKIINTTIGGIRYNLIENQIVACLKKLYVSTLFKSKPWFKAKPIEKLKQDFERQKQELHEIKRKLLAEIESGKSSPINSGSDQRDVFGLGDLRVADIDKKIFELETKIDKLGYLDTFSTDFEDRNAIIFPEFEDAVKLPHYKELTSLYITDREFSEHIIIKLCMRLQGILYSIARNSDQMNILNKERISEMYSYYGRSVPEHLQAMIDSSDCKRLDPRNAPERVNVFMFLSQITQNIELNVMTSEGPVSKMLDFKLPAQSFFLSNQTRKNFLYETEPDEMVDKAIEKFPKFLIEMKRNYHFYNNQKWLYMLSASDLVTAYKVIIWYLSFGINCVLVFSARTGPTGQKEFVGVSRTFFIVAPLILAGLCAVVLSLWSQGKYPELIQTSKLKYKRHFSKPKPPLSIKFKVYVWETILQKRTPFQMIFTIVFCLLGAFWNEFFLTLLLIMIMFISNTASYIVRSITTHAKQLGLTFVMAIFVMYIFSFIAYTNYNKSWDSLVDNNGTIEMCTDLWECTMYSIMFGFLNGGGLGDSFSTPDAHNRTGQFFGRFFFDVLFFILISVIALNIAFGIIIDTFASMRDDQARRLKQLRSTCVVCRKTKSELEQSGESARMHISSKHSIWNYVNYMLYLNLTEKSKFNSIENAVYESLRENSTDWIPSQANRLISENKMLSNKVTQKMEHLVSQIQTKQTTLLERVGLTENWFERLVKKITDQRAKDDMAIDIAKFTGSLAIPKDPPAEPKLAADPTNVPVAKGPDPSKMA